MLFSGSGLDSTGTLAVLFNTPAEGCSYNSNTQAANSKSPRNATLPVVDVGQPSPTVLFSGLMLDTQSEGHSYSPGTQVVWFEYHILDSYW